MAVCDIALEKEMKSHDVKIDGYAYIGAKAHKNMHSCGFIVSDRLADSYITTAMLRRSGHHPELHSRNSHAVTEHAATSKALKALDENPDLKQWLVGHDEPNSIAMKNTTTTIPVTKVLHPLY